MNVVVTMQNAPRRMTSPTTQPRIMIVDDDPDIGWLLKRYLERNGMTVELAVTGDAFRRRWREAIFDLAVIDIALPDEDGLQLVQWLREQDYRGGIIVLTASTESSDTVMSLDLGADDHVIKPCEARVVLARIRSVLRSRESILN